MGRHADEARDAGAEDGTVVDALMAGLGVPLLVDHLVEPKQLALPFTFMLRFHECTDPPPVDALECVDPSRLGVGVFDRES